MTAASPRRELDRASLPSPLKYLQQYDLLGDKKPKGEWAYIKCPSHKSGNEKHPSMGVSLVDGHYYCHQCYVAGGDIVDLHRLRTGDGFLDAVQALNGRFKEVPPTKSLAPSARAAQPTGRPTPTLVVDNELRDRARAMWVEAAPLGGTLGAEYLHRRGCILPPADGDVRFHPQLFCRKVDRNLPAIVCRVSTVIGNHSIGVHRIFLDPLGSDKAIAKMRLGGCDEPVCIRLFPDDHVTTGLAIAEGVETALAAARLFTPIWSTIDAGQMTVFPVLPGIATLTIYADHDQAGIKAAVACMDRWRTAGRAVHGIAPKRLGADLNDIIGEVAHGC